jgi:hypothetical protein
MKILLVVTGIGDTDIVQRDDHFFLMRRMSSETLYMSFATAAVYILTALSLLTNLLHSRSSMPL